MPYIESDLESIKFYFDRYRDHLRSLIKWREDIKYFKENI